MNFFKFFSRFSFLYDFISLPKGLCCHQKDMMIALSLFLLAFTIFLIPTLHQFASLGWSWHDHGHTYYIYRNLFEYGDFFSQDLNGTQMEYHFTPFFYLMSVIFTAGNSLFFFVLLHVLALSTIVCFIFLTTISLGWSRLVGLVLSCLIIVNPYVMSANLYPHYEVFGILALVVAVFGLVRNSWWMFLLALSVMLTCKEDMWIYSVCSLLPFIYLRQFRRQALYGIAISLVYWIVVLHFLWPAIYPNRVNFLPMIWSYGAKGELDVLFHLVSHPLSSLPKMITGSGFWFLAGLGFVPFLSPLRSLGGFAVLFLWVNATEPHRQSLTFYYGLPILMVFILNALTFQHNQESSPRFFYQLAGLGKHIRTESLLAGFLFFAALVSTGMQVHTPQPLKMSPSLRSVFSRSSGEEHNIFFERGLPLLQQFGSDGVLADFWLAGYVPFRKDLFLFHRHGKDFIEGKYSPSFVLYSEGKKDPLATSTLVDQIRQRILRSGEYRKVESSAVFSLYAHKRLRIPEKKNRSLPVEIDLSQTRALDRVFFLSGWHAVEEDFVWSSGLAVVALDGKQNNSRKIRLEIKAHCSLAPLLAGHQTLHVYIKGFTDQKVEWEIGLNSAVYVANFELPKGQKVVEIMFQSLNPLIPKNIGFNQDSRELGFQLERLSITNLQ